MKALILAGGQGKRFGRDAEFKNKCMQMLAGKPVIEYSLDNIVTTDVDEIVIVVGYKAPEIINKYGVSYKGKRIKYVIQSEQKGVVHAIECSEDTMAGDDFLLLLGDEILVNPKHVSMVEEFRREDVFGVCGVVVEKDREKIKGNYSLLVDESRRIYRLVEKPRNPFNDFMGTGNCVFKNEIFSYIEQTPINMQRGQKELPDLIQCAIDEGKLVKSFVICDKYVNINSEEDLEYAKNLLTITLGNHVTS